MKIVIAGGSGFVGQKLTEVLLQSGHEVVALSRSAKNGAVQWLTEGASPENKLGKIDAFVNLAGVSINDGRWSDEHQKQIYNSRMTATDELLRIISALPHKPAVLVNASAIGIYPSSESAIYTENSTAIADDFLGRTVDHWEQKAASVTAKGVRSVCMRFGVILGKGGGALPPMILPYKLFAGGKVGSGRQWLSWVHVEDVARAIAFAIEQENLQGPVNTTAPFPMQMDDFGKTIGSVMHRPHWFPVPSFIMKIALGKKSALVLEGQHVLPEKLLANGFVFKFPHLEQALQDILRGNV